MIKLLTGIPRSGTTLSCKLLNQHQHCLALHEPLDHNQIGDFNSTSDFVGKLVPVVYELQSQIRQKGSVVVGDARSLMEDNPVGDARDSQGKRVVAALRGTLDLPHEKIGHTNLFVKHNALFTALLPELAHHFEIIAIVRNPVDVLLSWMSVDLPVNRGSLPAAERFDSTLKESLAITSDVTLRQIHIYQWFCERFQNNHITVVKYEDIVKTNGTCLDESLALTPLSRTPLSFKHRAHSVDCIARLDTHFSSIASLARFGMYGEDEIGEALYTISRS